MMFSRNEIIKQIRDSFLNSLLKTTEELGFEDFNAVGMRQCVTEFVSSRAEAMSDEDLLTGFGDPKDVLDCYITFLKGKLEGQGVVTNCPFDDSG